jgi:hypothetical protein
MALKVYGGLTMLHGKQVRTIVATTSQKAAAELVGISLSYLRGYWSETWNRQELEVALAQPGTVFRTDLKGKEFFPLTAEG